MQLTEVRPGWIQDDTVARLIERAESCANPRHHLPSGWRSPRVPAAGLIAGLRAEHEHARGVRRRCQCGFTRRGGISPDAADLTLEECVILLGYGPDALASYLQAEIDASPSI
jgi:hypothetical protein